MANYVDLSAVFKGFSQIFAKNYGRNMVATSTEHSQNIVMAALGDIVRNARNRAGMSQDALAANANLSKFAIQQIETGRTKVPRAATLLAIARAFGFSTWEDVIASVVPRSPSNGHGGRIPILTKIPASWGSDSEVNDAYDFEEAIDYLPPLPGTADPRAFGLVVEGDSMAPRYAEGEVVVCSPTAWLHHGFESGRRYAIRFKEDHGGGTTVKRVERVDDHQIDLIPENDRHPTRRVPDEQIQLAALVVGRYISE